MKFLHQAQLFAIFIMYSVTGIYAQNENNDTTNLLARWLSSSSSLEQRMQAASQLVPVGTKQGESERILGPPTRRTRRHGPVAYIGQKTNAAVNGTIIASPEYVDQWRNFYDFSSGDFVCVTFDMLASQEDWKSRPRLDIWAGNTNDMKK